MATNPENKIGATEKAVRILDALERLDGAGVTELADHLGVSKGTVHNHLSTLEEHEYVVNSNGTYRLGLRLFEMGQYTRREQELYRVAKPEIDKLAAETGELANLMVEQHGRGCYLYISRGEHAVKLDTQVGTRQYLHTSALGKAILAHMPASRRDAVLDRHGLPEKTPNTVTDRAKLEAELAEIRERGVAFDGEERAEGIRCVAAPILGTDDVLRGAVSVSGPASRIKDEHLEEEIPETVTNTANVIDINLTYS